MEKTSAAITCVNGWVPDYILTNEELGNLINKPSDWIFERTGIRERRILKTPHLATSDLAVFAIEGLLEKKDIDPQEIDLIICATITPDMFVPSTACIIADKIGAINAFGFDINAACSGFLYALQVAAALIEIDKYKKIIVVAADKMSSIVDYTNENCILFGDAAGAVLLEKNHDGAGVIDTILKSDGSGKEHLYLKAGGSFKPASIDSVVSREHYLYLHGNSVFKSAVTSMSTVIKEIMEKNCLTENDIQWLVPHQANKRIIDATVKNLNFSEDKVMVNVQKYGNTSAATIPLCLWEWESKLKTNDTLILVSFGAGYTWGAVYLKWV